jgi:hypothetical protein
MLGKIGPCPTLTCGQANFGQYLTGPSIARVYARCAHLVEEPSGGKGDHGLKDSCGMRQGASLSGGE